MGVWGQLAKAWRNMQQNSPQAAELGPCTLWVDFSSVIQRSGEEAMALRRRSDSYSNW